MQLIFDTSSNHCIIITVIIVICVMSCHAFCHCYCNASCHSQEVSLQGEEEEEVMEQQRLRHLVGLQSQEIMALKDEIRTLSHKGGHILPPPHAPMAAAVGNETTHNSLL